MWTTVDIDNRPTVYKKSPLRGLPRRGRERQVPGIDRAWSRERNGVERYI